jgi:hypothetical protein
MKTWLLSTFLPIYITKWPFSICISVSSYLSDKKTFHLEPLFVWQITIYQQTNAKYPAKCHQSLPISCVGGPFLPLTIISFPSWKHSWLSPLLMLPSPLFVHASQECVDIILPHYHGPHHPWTPILVFQFWLWVLARREFWWGIQFLWWLSLLPKVDFLAASSLGDDEFEYDNMPCNFSVKSIVLLRLQDPKHHNWKKHAKHGTNNRASVMTSCWYINYLVPGPVWQLTHDLGQTDMAFFSLVLHASLQGGRAHNVAITWG